MRRWGSFCTHLPQSVAFRDGPMAGSVRGLSATALPGRRLSIHARPLLRRMCVHSWNTKYTGFGPDVTRCESPARISDNCRIPERWSPDPGGQRFAARMVCSHAHRTDVVAFGKPEARPRCGGTAQLLRSSSSDIRPGQACAGGQQPVDSVLPTHTRPCAHGAQSFMLHSAE